MKSFYLYFYTAFITGLSILITSTILLYDWRADDKIIFVGVLFISIFLIGMLNYYFDKVSYKCKSCGKLYNKNLWASSVKSNALTARKFKCPHCGDINIAKETLEESFAKMDGDSNEVVGGESNG